MRVDLWTETELNLLRENYADATKEELLKLFPNRPNYEAIKTKANLLGLKKGVGNHGRKYWTKVEIEKLEKLYPETLNKVLAQIFNCSIDSITHVSNKHGFKKTLEFKQNMVSAAFLNAGKKTRFNPGNISFNKGRKLEEYMSKENIEKIKKTQFKKGNLPHNHQEIGHERITKDGYIEIKVNDFSGYDSTENYQLKHRVLWEKHYGKIPDGMNVSFKENASKTEFTIDDLMLLSKAENLLINTMCDDSIVKRFLGVKDPKSIEIIKNNNPELIKLKRNQIKLTKKINDHAKRN